MVGGHGGCEGCRGGGEGEGDNTAAEPVMWPVDKQEWTAVLDQSDLLIGQGCVPGSELQVS